MAWQEVQDGLAKRFVLEDGTPVVALLKDAGEGYRLTFFSDVSDFERVELEAERLGELPDLIDALLPEDIIEVCCQTERISRTH